MKLNTASSLSLFNIRYVATIKKFNLLKKSYRYKEMIDLIQWMNLEAQKLNIEQFSDFEDTLKHIFESRQDSFSKIKHTVNETLDIFLIEAKSVKDNEYKDKSNQDKQKTITILNTTKGLASYGGDMSLYLKHLIGFYDTYKDSILRINIYIEDEDLKSLLELLSSIQVDAKTIEAQVLLDVLDNMFAIFEEEKIELKNWMAHYGEVYKV